MELISQSRKKEVRFRNAGISHLNHHCLVCGIHYSLFAFTFVYYCACFQLFSVHVQYNIVVSRRVSRWKQVKYI